MGSHESLKFENYKTDYNNFLKNVFFLEKFAEIKQARTIHCFAEDYIDFRKEGHSPLVLEQYTLRNCWPHWDSKKQRRIYNTADLARDGKHLGTKHHERFAELFLEKFSGKLK